MVLQVLGSAKNPKKRRVLDIMGIPAMKIGDRRWWFLPSWNNLWVHPKHACASAPATNASEACDPTEASEINSTRWSSKMVMCFEIFQCAYWSWKWSPPGRWFFLVMVIGWAFGGWRKPLCGFQMIDDWPNKHHWPSGIHVERCSQNLWRAPRPLFNGCWRTQLANRCNGDDFRWSKAGGGNRLKTQKAQIQSDV